jgi:hypothetical protein
LWVGSSPPDCSGFYNFLAIDTDEGDVPFLISFGRTSAKVGKQLVTMLTMYRLQRTIVISTVPQDNNQGKYFILTVQTGDTLSPERQAYYALLARKYAGHAITTDTETDTVDAMTRDTGPHVDHQYTPRAGNGEEPF